MDRLEAMRVFVAVADGGSFAGAGRTLGLSPPAVTRAVAGLEAHLGARLLTRTTRQVRLTDAGARYLEDCRRLLAQLADAEAAAAGSHGAVQGELVVTAPTQFGRLHVAPLLPPFLDRHPAVSVRVHLLDRLVNLVEEGVDVAVRIGEPAQSTLVAVGLGRVRRVVVGAPAYLEARGVPRRIDDLEAHSLIAASSLMPGGGWTFGQGGQRRTVRIRSRLVTTTPDVAIDAAVGGFGLTQVPIYQVMGHLEADRLRVVLADVEPAMVPVTLMTAEGRGASSKIRSFVDMAVPALRRVLRADARGAGS